MPFDETKLFAELAEIKMAHALSARDRVEIKESLAKLEERTENLPLLARDVLDLQHAVNGNGDDGLVRRVGDLEKTEIRRKATLFGIAAGSGIGGAGLLEIFQKLFK